MIPLIPDNAPFTSEQRAWLNGFFAGLMGDAAQGAESAPVAAAPIKEENFPWHDPALELPERLKLAEGRPIARRMMAAMAQLDCGQCGYQCQTYAEAVAAGAEKDLARCVPGGKPTARKLKELLAARPEGAAVPASPAVAWSPANASAQSDPAPAHFVASHRLNADGSDKDTRHVVFHLNGSGLTYEVGDSLGVHALNCPDLAAAILVRLGIDPGIDVTAPDGKTRPLLDTLIETVDITRPSDEAIEVLSRHAGDADEAARLKALAEGAEDSAFESADLLDLLEAFPSARPPAGELAAALGALKPRLYSIASSPKAHPGEVHLTVAAVRYDLRGRARKGVASTFLADRVHPERHVPVYVQEAHGFRLPADPTTPIVMIGPGTGIAPFRAFIEERRVVGAKGRNWLFFGDRRRTTDYLFESEFEAYRQDGLLTRLDLAFSRDTDAKVYIQDRMRENAKELWAWLQDGAHVYVCGDAKRMASDVDKALVEIVAKEGAMSADAAKAYVAGLARDKRYLRDVY